MNKVFMVLSLVVLFSCTTLPNYYSFDEALENGIHKIENDLPESSDIAILDFKSDNPNLSSYIIEEMYDKLINNRKLSIMERSRIDTIAMEVGYQLSGEVDDKEIISIGHQLGADYVVTGQISFSGEAYRLRVFAIDIEKGRRVASSSLNIRSNDRQINYLLSSRINENTQVVNTINNAKNDDILYESVQGLLKRIPKNSRVLITGITGSNDIKAQYIQATIANEAKDMLIITEDQRTTSMEMQKNILSDEYSYDSVVTIGNMDGANIIVTGGIFGAGESRRIVFRALDVESGLIVSESCVLFTQNNTELINNVEALSQRINSKLSKNIRNDASIVVINNVGTSRNGDFIFDIIENNLVNLFKYKVVTRSELGFIREEQKFQMSDWVSIDTSIRLGHLIGAQYVLNIEYTNGKIQVAVFDINKGNSFMQETM